MTSHGGTYASIVTGNEFLQCRSNGIANRSRNAIVSDNLVTGSQAASSYGINIYEGWARDCVISNNSISGFYYGVQVLDGPEVDEQFTWVGLHVFGNTITNFGMAGVITTRQSANKYIGETGLVIENNIIRGSYQAVGVAGRLIALAKYTVGAQILNNTGDLQGKGTAGIHLDAECNDTRIEGNLIANSGNRSIWMVASADVAVWPSGVRVYLGSGNREINAPNGQFVGAGVSTRAKFNGGGPTKQGAALAVAGSRSSGVAGTNLLALLHDMGLIVNNTTA
jgi:hypothetical protein